MATSLSNIDPIRQEPVATQVARRLVEVILAGEIEPGSRMPSDRQLAESFGVGRSAMREALKALSLIGLVEIRQGDGTYLRTTESALLPEVLEWGLLIGEKRTMDLVEARKEIEVVLAGLAAQRRTDAELEELRLALDDMRNSANVEDFVEKDVVFHLKMSASSGNLVLRDVHRNIQALLHAWIKKAVTAAGETQSTLLEHMPIYDAIEKGDVEAARLAMARHMEEAGKRLERSLLRDGFEADEDVRTLVD